MYKSLSKSIGSLGTVNWAQELLVMVNEQVCVDHVSIFFFDQNLIPQVTTAASKNGSNLAWQVGQKYQHTLFYQQDPNIEKLNKKLSASVNDNLLILRLRASDILDQDYRQLIYEKHNLSDRLSIISQFEGRWFAINFYRDRVNGLFSQKDIFNFKKISILVVALLCKQYSISPEPSWENSHTPSIESLESLLDHICNKLSNREKQVCSRALVGITNNGISLEFGIKVSTVATLRKRAFVKLNISSLNELFALCLSSAARLS